MSLQGLELPTLPAATTAPRIDEATYRRLAKRAQRPNVVGNEVLGPLGDPGEITDAELIRACQRGRDGQARWVRERARLLSQSRSANRVQALVA